MNIRCELTTIAAWRTTFLKQSEHIRAKTAKVL